MFPSNDQDLHIHQDSEQQSLSCTPILWAQAWPGLARLCLEEWCSSTPAPPRGRVDKSGRRALNCPQAPRRSAPLAMAARSLLLIRGGASSTTTPRWRPTCWWRMAWCGRWGATCCRPGTRQPGYGSSTPPASWSCPAASTRTHTCSSPS